MKRVIIFYFTGTGHTGIVAGMLTEALHNQGVHVDCRRIDCCLREEGFPDISAYDAVGIGYPIYAFNVPRTVEDFIRLFPKNTGKLVFVFKTAGEPFLFNKPSSYFIHGQLRRRGYALTYERLFLMPYNIVFRYPDEVVKEIYILSERLAEKMAVDIVRGVEVSPRYNPLLLLISLIMRIQFPGARLNGRLMRATKDCNLCGKCVRECRAENIRIEGGRVRFGWKCVMCMRCVMFCPKGAVKAGFLERWAVRGAYDFKGIVGNPALEGDTIKRCKKGFFGYFKKYVRDIEALTREPEKDESA